MEKIIEMKEKRTGSSVSAPSDYKTQDLEQKLNNYMNLYNECQVKLTEAIKERDNLKV